MLGALYIVLVVFIFAKFVVLLYEYQTYIRSTYMQLISSYKIDNSILNAPVVEDVRATASAPVTSHSILESQSGVEFSPIFELIQ